MPTKMPAHRFASCFIEREFKEVMERIGVPDREPPAPKLPPGYVYTPIPSHLSAPQFDMTFTPTVGTVRCCETPDPERNCDRRDDQLFTWCVLAVVVAGYAALLGFALWMGTR
jgi:hypothetical protein